MVSESVGAVVGGGGASPPKVIESFDAKVIDKGDGTVEIRLRHRGKDLCTTTVGGEALAPLIDLARRLIANPPKSPFDDTIGMKETVVTVLRNSKGERVRYDPAGVRLN
jgi:hypothetical protein